MAINTYDYGAVVRLIAPLTVAGGGAADATTLQVTVRPPSGQDVIYTLAGGQIIHDTLGQYHIDIAANQVGLWEYDWASTGPQAAYRGAFMVRPAVL